MSQVPNIFVVNASVQAKDLKEFITLAKAKPGQLTDGSAENAGHLAFEYPEPACIKLEMTAHDLCAEVVTPVADRRVAVPQARAIDPCAGSIRRFW